MADIFDVLSDDTRRTILSLLLARSTSSTPEVSVPQMVAATGHSQPSVSKQLKVLRDAGLVSVREDGQLRLYRLDPAPLREVGSWLAGFVGSGGTESGGTGSATAGSAASSPAGTGARSSARPTRRARTGVQLPDFVLDAARDLGAAAADLAGKAPWR